MKLTDKILVTGSQGFIGTHLMKALGDKGVGFDLRGDPSLDILYYDDLETVIKGYKPKCIIHLAAVSTRNTVDRDPQHALHVNVIGTYNVLQIAQKYGIRVILASSASVEETSTSLYAITKDVMEKMAALFDYKDIVVARLYNVYGRGSKSVVNKFVKDIKNNIAITLNGNTTRDYIHVDDVVKELVFYVKVDEPEEIVLVGTGEATTLKDLVKIIEKKVKRKATVIQGQPIREIQESHCYTPLDKFIKLEKGIERL